MPRRHPEDDEEAAISRYTARLEAEEHDRDSQEDRKVTEAAKELRRIRDRERADG